MPKTKLVHAIVVAAIGLSLSAGALMPTSAHAAAPMVKKSAPGYYRMMLGEFEVTAISDGTVELPMDKLLKNSSVDATNKAFAKYYLKPPIETSVNAYLINTGTKLVLVDTGAGALFGPTLGNTVANLKASGYEPDQVDEIYITHMHPDHVGGLMAGDKMVFPNAVVRADKKDADFWLSEANLAKAAEGDKGFFQGAMASLNPYVKAGKFSPFTGDTQLVPGIKAMSSYGHTAGHTTYMVESKGQKLVLWGDLMHAAAVQFDNPAVTIAFDSDHKGAAAQRAKAYAAAAKEGYIVGSTHVSFPGLGRLRASGKGYIWVPVNYSVVR
jgi:glyoxylase-like metal-dependent hydrolase (beta-lactamase superfamily II)